MEKLIEDESAEIFLKDKTPRSIRKPRGLI
jgi:hypothetical protein